MICPYIVHLQQTERVVYEYDDEEKCVAENHILGEVKIPMACKQEKCGAWQNGRCCYAEPTIP